MMQAKVSKHVEEIPLKSWYQQGGASNVYYVYNPYRAAARLFGQPIFVYNKGIINSGFFDKTAEEKIARAELAKHKQDQSVLQSKIDQWQLVTEELNKELAFIGTDEFSAISDNALGEYLKKIGSLTIKQWDIAINIEPFDPWGDFLLQEELQSCSIPLSPEELQTMVTSYQLGYLQRELIDRVKIVEDALINNQINADLVARHLKKYFWLKNNWAEQIKYTRNELEEQLVEDMKNVDVLRKEVARLLTFERDIRDKKKQIIEDKHVPDSLAKVFDFFSILSDWRDARKQNVLIYIDYLAESLKILEGKSGVSFELLQWALPQEISGWKLSSDFVDVLKARSQECMCLFDEQGEVFWLKGSELREVHASLLKCFEDKKDVKGSVAVRGKASGRIRHIEVVSDFPRMCKGDVLIAKMTRPEMLPIMKLASAIVTDEGGITCHAAIVARELGIPCIIGTQTATMLLEDGDMVEVDADKGIVRKI